MEIIAIKKIFLTVIGTQMTKFKCHNDKAIFNAKFQNIVHVVSNYTTNNMK